jgi:hypothetical protein
MDKLVEKFPEHFLHTVVDVYKTKSVVTGKWDAYKRDLMKWRWKLIKKHEESAAVAVELREVPEQDNNTINNEDILDPLDEENYILLADDEYSEDESPTSVKFSKSLVDDDDGKEDAAADDSADDEIFAVVDALEAADKADSSSSDDDGRMKESLAASAAQQHQNNKKKKSSRKHAAVQQQNQLEIYKPSKNQQKKILGYDLSSSSNTDLYSTDEERVGKHRKQDQASSLARRQGHESMKDPFMQSTHQHCTKCTGVNKVPHIVFEISADGVQMQKHAAKSASWPLMGQILYISPCKHLRNKVRFYMPRNSNPVILGFYLGTTKPSCANQYLKCVFKEMKLAEKRGLCTSFLKFYVGDGPSRQFIKGFPSSTAYCGCERYVILILYIYICSNIYSV